MKKLKFLPIFLSLCVMASLLLAPGVLALDEPAVESASAMIIDRSTGEVLFEHNADARVYPASTTKIMTILLAVEAIESGSAALSDEVTASANITFDLVADGSSAGIMVGETMTLESLLYAAMLSSANEACNIIAEHIGGSISGFVSMMNSRAAELGCTATSFTNTHGLPDDNHYTTARDFSLIAQEAARHELLMKLCSTPTTTIPGTNMSGERTLTNSNALISTGGIYGNNYLYEYADGIKTGYTSAAGYCLVSTASNGEIDLLACVFGGEQTWTEAGAEYSNFSDSIAMFEWVFNNFSYREVLRSADNLTSVPVEMGSNADSVNLRPESSITVLLPNDSDFSEFQLEVDYNFDDKGGTLKAPVSAGDVLGQVTLSKNGVNYGTVNLVAASGVDLSRGDYIKTEIQNTMDSKIFKIILWSVVILLVAYLALVIVYRVKRERHRRALRQARIERARSEREAAARQAAAVPAPPTIDYFTEVEIEHDTEQPQTPAAKAERDYFEEFFKNN